MLAASRQWDVALLRIEANNLPALDLGTGLETVSVGESVLAVGHPEGLEGTVSTGIVSAVRFDEDMEIHLIQTTAPISKGSSGGPLLNVYDEVIGINTHTYVRGQNLNFAVPVDFMHQLLDGAGTAQTLAEVFGAFEATTSYQPLHGELAVVWRGMEILILTWRSGPMTSTT